MIEELRDHAVQVRATGHLVGGEGDRDGLAFSKAGTALSCWAQAATVAGRRRTASCSNAVAWPVAEEQGADGGGLSSRHDQCGANQGELATCKTRTTSATAPAR